jgi:hypothetical protein
MELQREEKKRPPFPSRSMWLLIRQRVAMSNQEFSNEEADCNLEIVPRYAKTPSSI